MALAGGIKLGCYEVVAAIGAEGMGEGYQARDTRPPERGQGDLRLTQRAGRTRASDEGEDFR